MGPPVLGIGREEVPTAAARSGWSRRVSRWSRRALVAGEMGAGESLLRGLLAASVELMREIAQRALAQ
jgi:hypothetical protein